jgi:adenylylsulfate kinase-like enzyme
MSPANNRDSMAPVTCPNCKGTGRYIDPSPANYNSSSIHCNMCNGKGVETKWICRAGKHRSLVFDDINNDPRTMPCPECSVGFVQELQEGDPTIIAHVKSQISIKNLPRVMPISYEEEMAQLAQEEEASEAMLGLSGVELAVAQGLDEFTAIKYGETKKGKLYFMVGLPRAGKTTLMNKWQEEGPNRVIICFDNIRLALYEKDHLQQMEPFLWEFGTTMAKTLLLSGYDVMMDDTHTSKWKRDYYKDLGGFGMYLNTPLDVCLSRAPQNHHSFKAAIRRMAARLEGFDPKAEDIAVVDWKSIQKP